MTSHPTRADTGGQRYLDLRKQARATARPTDELLQLYALEGFLARLHESNHSNALVLKGGVLLAAFGARRPTRDIDFAATSMSNDAEVVRMVVRDVLLVTIDDGLDFDDTGLVAQAIREGDLYSGVRISVKARLASANLRFHVDVNVGDPIWPAPTDILLPRLLGGEPLRVVGYPVAMVLAEKIVTAIARGAANTRWRDFVDIAKLGDAFHADSAELATAIEHVANHRDVRLRPLSEVLDGFGPLAQSRWTAWRRKQGLLESTPEDFDDLIGAVTRIFDPLLLRPER